MSDTLQGTRADSIILDEAQLIPFEDDGNKDRLTHIVNPPNNLHLWGPGMTSKDLVFLARLKGVEIVALCGYKFVPKHDPEKYKACEQCIDLAGEIMRGMGE